MTVTPKPIAKPVPIPLPVQARELGLLPKDGRGHPPFEKVPERKVREVDGLVSGRGVHSANSIRKEDFECGVTAVEGPKSVVLSTPSTV